MAETASNRESKHPGPAPATESPRPLKHGESQWALVWREFRRRRLAVLSGCLILALITVSIFAPFLANDRPICYRGYNRFEYREAMRTSSAVIANLIKLQTTGADDRERGNGRKQAKIIERQIGLMARCLSREKAAELRELGKRLTGLAVTPDDGKRAAGELRQIRVDLRQRFDARKVEFISRWHWPVFATLIWGDVGFLVLNVLLITLPVWRSLVRRVIPRDPSSARTTACFAVLFGLPVLCALGAWMTIPDRMDRTDYKAGVLQAGDGDASQAPVVYETVLWPPIPYGLDEDNLDAEYLRPAAWPGCALEAAAGNSNPGDLEAAFVPGPWDQPHWLGTDSIGRDALSRMIWGGRVSLAVGVVAVSIYVTIGIIVGSIAGYFRGVCDLIVSRLIEIVICFPSFFLILTIVAFLGPSIFNIMVVIGVIGWTGVARLVRGEFLRLGEQEFVLAGRALGDSPLRIIFRHVLPNAMAPVLVSATFGIAGAILTESALSFLGFGITVPKPSWGGILASGRDSIFRAPWLIYFPGFAIFLTITAYNLVGEALRDAADPRLRGQLRG